MPPVASLMTTPVRILKDNGNDNGSIRGPEHPKTTPMVVDGEKWIALMA